MPAPARRIAKLHGTPEVGVSRYLVLYLTQIGWFILGSYLMLNAVWPSTCQPTTFMKAVTCSVHLADNRGWIESALMCWLWSSPLLVGLELSRRLGGKRR